MHHEGTPFTAATTPTVSHPPVASGHGMNRCRALDDDQASPMTSSMTEPALQIRVLSKSFDKPVITGLDLEIAAGQLYALLGPNGAGKTTTLRMVTGLTRPDAGSIQIF